MDLNITNVNQLMSEATNRTKDKVRIAADEFSKINWAEQEIIIPLAPKPSQRPRLSGYRVYVPGAAKNATFFNNRILPKYKDVWIDTPCIVYADIYMATPASFSDAQKIMAEMKVLRPWTHTGDIDNLQKSLFDMIQPNAKRHHRGIMADDSLIIETYVNKYYSMTPRYEMRIKYMVNVPEACLKFFKFHNYDVEK